MISVDDRTGSKDLAPRLKARGLPVTLTRMEFGDVSWLGRGPNGLTPVGVEVKRISDVLQCIKDGRFAGHQLPGLQDNYEVIYLMIEGLWKADKDTDELLVWERGNWIRGVGGQRLWRQLDHWLCTMETLGGVRVVNTSSRDMTVKCIHSRYTWWTAKEWAEHRSHVAYHQPMMKRGILKPSFAVRVAAQIRGVGWEKAGAVEKRFKTVQAMVDGGEAEWKEVPGIGKTLAKAAWAMFRTPGIR